MSYVRGWDGEGTATDTYGGQGGLGAFDIAALQALYGANDAYNAHDNTYVLPDVNAPGTGWSAIWDTGGTDTISNAGSNDACTIDLRAAPLLGPDAGGYVSHVDGILGGFTIANGVEIEKAVGGGGDDTLFGNGSANVMIGNAGDDTINGQGGEDTLKGSGGNDDLVGAGSNDKLYGGSGKDGLNGGGGEDQLFGNGGRDVLDGGKGSDQLNGGGGTDKYDFTEKPGDGVDAIVKFEAGEQLRLDSAAFKHTGAHGTLKAKYFYAGAHAHDSNDHILYQQSTGKVFYDSNGDAAGGRTLFAILDNTPHLHYDDIFVI